MQVERIEAHIQQVNPRCAVFQVSASSGVGLEAWHGWLRASHAAQCPAPEVSTAESLSIHSILVSA